MSKPTKITVGDTFKGTTVEEYSGDGEEGNFTITVTAVYPDRVVRVSDHQDGWYEQIGAIDCTLKQFGFSDSHYNYEVFSRYGIEQILDNDLYADRLLILEYNLANQ
jgi:hypothetical protein